MLAARLLLAVAVFAAGASAWGHVGHSVVAQLAVNMLTPEAKSVVGTFMGKYHTLAQVAPWPDTYAHTPWGLWSLPLHYANLPVGAQTFSLERDCPASAPCVIRAIMNYTAISQAEGKRPFACTFSEYQAPCALEFLTHFVGDSHQPLHVGFGCDQGGNTVKISFFGLASQLHKVWDELIINQWQPNYHSAAAELQAMINADPSLIAKYASSLDPTDWAKESFGYDLSNVYVFGQGAGITNCCGRPAVDGAHLKANNDLVEVGQWYIDQNLPLIKQRLIAAGVRLGTILNKMFVNTTRL